MDACTIYREYRERHPEGHYFDADTLNFFGESLARMRVEPKPVKVYDEWDRKYHNCWVLVAYQSKAPVGVSKWKKTYFDTETFDIVNV